VSREGRGTKKLPTKKKKKIIKRQARLLQDHRPAVGNLGEKKGGISLSQCTHAWGDQKLPSSEKTGAPTTRESNRPSPHGTRPPLSVKLIQEENRRLTACLKHF